MTHECTEHSFLESVASHIMTEHLDNGVYRHLEFGTPGSSSNEFHLLTFPGHLTITGDCGTYTFKRDDDMFSFFRTDEEYKRKHLDKALFIKPDYWGEKLLSKCMQGGFKEYSEKLFVERVTRYFDNRPKHLWVGQGSEMWDAIKENVLSFSGNEHEAYASANKFSFSGDFYQDDFCFWDFFDGGGTEEYTNDYIWNLYAIVCGIETYDAVKSMEKSD